MAEKKDCFIKGKIYIGVAEPLPSGTYSYNHAIPKWEEKIKGLTSYPVTGTHSFKNGQDVTGFWKLQHQRMHFDADEWEDCSELAYERGSKYDFQVIAITIPPVSPPDELDREAKLIKFIESELLICESEILNSKFLIMHDVKLVGEYWRGKRDAYTTLKQKI